nr:unnamed protein product [Haemonchus contortus]
MAKTRRDRALAAIDALQGGLLCTGTRRWRDLIAFVQIHHGNWLSPQINEVSPTTSARMRCVSATLAYRSGHACCC